MMTFTQKRLTDQEWAEFLEWARQAAAHLLPHLPSTMHMRDPVSPLWMGRGTTGKSIVLGAAETGADLSDQPTLLTEHGFLPMFLGPLIGSRPRIFGSFSGAGVGRGILQLTGRENWKPRDRRKPRPSPSTIKRARQKAQRLARKATRKARP